jgi:hypothetical protein
MAAVRSIRVGFLDPQLKYMPSEMFVSFSVVCPKRESNPRFLGHNEMP